MGDFEYEDGKLAVHHRSIVGSLMVKVFQTLVEKRSYDGISKSTSLE